MRIVISQAVDGLEGFWEQVWMRLDLRFQLFPDTLPGDVIGLLDEVG